MTDNAMRYMLNTTATSDYDTQLSMELDSCVKRLCVLHRQYTSLRNTCESRAQQLKALYDMKDEVTGLTIYIDIALYNQRNA